MSVLHAAQQALHTGKVREGMSRGSRFLEGDLQEFLFVCFGNSSH